MSTAQETSELLLVEEVAREMRTTVWAVRSWIRAGRLPAVRPGKRLLIRRTDMVSMLRTAMVHPANAASTNAQGSLDGARTP